MPKNLIDNPATPSELGAYPAFSSKAEMVRVLREKGGRAGDDLAKRLSLTNANIWPDGADRCTD